MIPPRLEAISRVRWAILTAVALLGGFAPGAALSQSGLQPGPAAPAVPDTAVADLDFSARAVMPLQIHTVQDTVLFGDLFHLVLDFPEVVEGASEIPLSAGTDWLVPVTYPDPGVFGGLLGHGSPPGPDLNGLPAVPEGTRAVATFRVFRTNPFQVKAGPFLTPVIVVRGRVEGTADTAPIRSPRSVRWSPWVILGLAILLVLVLAAARLLWDRGNRGDEPTDRGIPVPAWIHAAIELRDLLGRGFLNRGESRPFLDGLAGIARRFVAGRFRIAAQEMTGREIVAACTGLGYLSPNPGRLARLIDAVDHHRYDPEAAAPGWCRNQAVLFFEEVGRVRILPRYTDVPAGLAKAGEAAWQDLGRELAAGSNRNVAAGLVPEGGKA